MIETGLGKAINYVQQKRVIILALLVVYNEKQENPAAFDNIRFFILA